MMVIFFILFNVCACPYYYVVARFLTPYVVVLFHVWWIYFEYKHSCWRGVAVGRLEGGHERCFL